MAGVMKRIQSGFGGGTITEAQLENVFHEALPDQTAACHARLDEFFTQWFDTAYPSGGGANRPQITGPGLSGPGFACAPTIGYALTPAQPTGGAGWYTGAVAIDWQVDNGLDATTSLDGCAYRSFTADGTFTESCSAANTAGRAGPVTVTVKRDASPPATAVTLTPTPVGAWYSPRTVVLTPTDGAGASGVASTSYRLDGGAWTPYGGPFAVTTFGPHSLEVRSADVAGNVEAARTTTWGADFTAVEQLAGLSSFVAGLGLDKGLTAALQTQLTEAAKRLGKGKDACGQLDDFAAKTADAAGKSDPRLTVAQAEAVLSAYQIEALLGCVSSASREPEAEHDLLTLSAAIDGLGLGKQVADDLGNRVRTIAKELPGGNRAASCRSLRNLSGRIADLERKGKLTAEQASTLRNAVAEISDELGC